MRPTAELVVQGLVQGAAEVLPVSSSAHLALLHGRHRSPAERKDVEVALHLGSALAMLAYGPRLRPRFLAVASAPAALAGYLLQRPVQERLGTRPTLAAGLTAGSLALLLADRAPQARRNAPGRRDAVAIGLAQACALVPGVSRAGATWAAARSRGFTRPAALELSRETALPILLGAAALRVRSREHAPGVAAAAASTALALRLPAHRLPASAWAAYRLGLAVAILAVRENRRR